MQSTPLEATKDIKGYITNGPQKGIGQRYDLPKECQNGRKGRKRRRCTLSPQCAPMANLTANQRKTLVAQYNQALFGIATGPASVRRTSTLKPVLVALILNYYYAPYTARYVDISIDNTNTSDWAEIDWQQAASSAGKISAGCER